MAFHSSNRAELGEQSWFVSISQVAISWCICQGAIPIPGAEKLEQAEDTMGVLGWRVTASELAALEEKADSAPRGIIQNIFQTS